MVDLSAAFGMLFESDFFEIIYWATCTGFCSMAKLEEDSTDPEVCNQKIQDKIRVLSLHFVFC